MNKPKCSQKGQQILHFRADKQAGCHVLKLLLIYTCRFGVAKTFEWLKNRLSPKKYFCWASHQMLRNDFGINWYYYSFGEFFTWLTVAVLPSFLPKMPIWNQPPPSKILLLLPQICTEWSKNLDMSYFEHFAPYVGCPSKIFFFELI